MDFSMILSLIMAIIQMIMQAFNGGPKPPPPPGALTFPEYAHVSCENSRWEDNQSSNMYVAGTVVKDCEVQLDVLPSGGQSVLEKMSGNIQADIEQVPGEVYETTSTESHTDGIDKAYDKTLSVDSEGEKVAVRGDIQLKSNFNNSLITRFSSTRLPKNGNGAYLKYVRTQTQIVQGRNSQTFHVRFSNYTTVLKPWFAPSSFGSILISQQKAKMESESQQSLADLLSRL